MLEHQKIVLQGVSDNKELFKKELYKSLKWLSSEEKTELKKWLEENCKQIHAETIEEAFDSNYNVAV